MAQGSRGAWPGPDRAAPAPTPRNSTHAHLGAMSLKACAMSHESLSINNQVITLLINETLLNSEFKVLRNKWYDMKSKW